LTKAGWRLLGKVQLNTPAWWMFTLGLTFLFWAGSYYSVLYLYQRNNRHRTFEAAIAKEKAHKKRLRDAELAAEAGSSE
jgi:hypothetical protein